MKPRNQPENQCFLSLERQCSNISTVCVNQQNAKRSTNHKSVSKADFCHSIKYTHQTIETNYFQGMNQIEKMYERQIGKLKIKKQEAILKINNVVGDKDREAVRRVKNMIDMNELDSLTCKEAENTYRIHQEQIQYSEKVKQILHECNKDFQEKNKFNQSIDKYRNKIMDLTKQNLTQRLDLQFLKRKIDIQQNEINEIKKQAKTKPIRKIEKKPKGKKNRSLELSKLEERKKEKTCKWDIRSRSQKRKHT